MTAINPLLPVKRQMIDVMTDQRLREQARPSDAARNRLWRLGGRDDVLLGRARATLHKLRLSRVFLLNVPHDVQARRLPLVLLRHFLADQHELATAALVEVSLADVMSPARS